jgi:DNA-binding response OmpR family regulator
MILLDCGLPRVGGVDVLRALKRDRRCSWIPIIMMTAAYDSEQVRQCRHLGCEAYITKWAVFLGLPGFVRRVRLHSGRVDAADRRQRTTGKVPEHHTRILDQSAVPGIVESCRYRQDLVGRKVRDGYVAP